MKRWDLVQGAMVEDPKIDEFLDDIIKVCKKHHLAISHEDIGGAFIVAPLSPEAEEWIRNAHVGFQA